MDDKESSSSKKKRKWRSWDETYQELKAYHAQHGHCKIGGHKRMQDWMKKQRFKHSILSPRQRDLLNQLDFDWAHMEKRTEYVLEGMIVRLLEFKKIHGHMNIPARYPGDQQLGRWATRLRHHNRVGKLSQYRKEKLDKIGFVWEYPQSAPSSRKASPSQTRRSVVSPQEDRDQNEQVRTDSTDKVDSSDTQQQKNASQDSARSVADETVTANGEKSPFAAEDDQQWEAQFKRLCLFKEVFHSTKYFELIDWVKAQSDLLRNGKLRYDRRAKLESIGTLWSPVVPRQIFGTTIHAGGNTARRGYAFSPVIRNGRTVAYQGDGTSPAVSYGRVVAYQGYGTSPAVPVERSATYHDRREATLGKNTASVETNKRHVAESHVTWHDMFEKLCWHKVNQVHCNVTAEQLVGRSELRTWSQIQRDLLARGELSQRKFVLLSAIGFDWVLGEETKAGNDEQGSPNGDSSKIVGSRILAPPQDYATRFESPSAAAAPSASDVSSRPIEEKVFGSSAVGCKDGPCKDPPAPDPYVGRRVAKYFGNSLYEGTVTKVILSFETEECIDLWTIKYDDGDEEDLDIVEMKTALELHQASLEATGHNGIVVTG